MVTSSEPGTAATLTPVRGTALYVGAVLGPGILTLPALAAAVAGPASLLALGALLVLSAALASTFAALARRSPGDSGLVGPVAEAFGARWGRVVSALFYLGVPPGLGALGLFGGSYLQAVVGGAHTDVLVAGALIVLTWALNRAGLRASAAVQVALTGVLLLVVLAAVLSAAPHVEPGNFAPVAPHGWAALAPAAFLLVWVLTGWEASANLAVALPPAALRRVVTSAVLTIAAAFLGLSIVLVGVLGSSDLGDAPVADLLAQTVGPAAGVLGVGLALVLTLGNMNAYVASLTALGATLRAARHVPGGPSTLPTGIALGSLALSQWHPHPASVLVGITAAAQVPVLMMALAAGVRLLPAGAARRTAVAATLGTTLLLVPAGPYLIAPAVIVGAVLLAECRPAVRRPSRGPGSAATEALLPCTGGA